MYKPAWKQSTTQTLLNIRRISKKKYKREHSPRFVRYGTPRMIQFATTEIDPKPGVQWHLFFQVKLLLMKRKSRRFRSSYDMRPIQINRDNLKLLAYQRNRKRYATQRKTP